MNAYLEFINECTKLPKDDVEFSIYVESIISEASNITISGEKVKSFLKSQSDEGYITSVGDGITRCVSYCDKKASKIPDIKKDSNFVAFKKLLSDISHIVETIVNEPNAQETSSESSIVTVMQTYENKIKELNKELDNVQKEVGRQRDVNESRMSSLITNNISILGIFVAIAFAGFGASAMFSNIPLSITATVSQNTFYIILVATLIYNLMFMLLWFVAYLSDYRSKFFGLRGLKIWIFVLIDIAVIILDIVLYNMLV